MSEPTLVQKIWGVEFRNPFLIASGQATTGVGQIHRFAAAIADNGWGGLVTKTIIPSYGVQLRPHLWSSPRFRLVAMQNSGPAMNIYSPELMKDLRRDAEACHRHGLRIIASLIGRSWAEWEEMAGRVQEAGVDAVELNLSCPSTRTSVQSSLGGLHVGQDADLSGRVVESVVRGTSLPVIAKLTPHAADVPAVAAACVEAGAAGLTAINTVRGIIGVDVDTARPLSANLWGYGYITGISGPAIRPVALGVVADVARRVSAPIMGVGGIAAWQDAVEFFLLGASLVQVCTAVMWYGLGLGTKLQRGLERYMREKGHGNLEQFRGLTLPHLTRAIPDGYPAATVEVAAERCNLCGMCITACQDGAFEALSRRGDTVVVDPDKCQICGLCMSVCKPGAISVRVAG